MTSTQLADKLVFYSEERNELAVRVFNKYPEYGHDENLWELEIDPDSEDPCRFTFTTANQAAKMGWVRVGVISE